VNLLYAFKTQAQNPKRADNTPLEWPWLTQAIRPAEREQYESDNWLVLTTPNYFDYLANANLANDLRVLKYVGKEFAFLPPQNIDFRKHLTVYLQKDVTMLPGGRPDRALYTYEGVNICEIKFTFETNAMNFITRRTETLFYFRDNGEKSEGYILRDDIYDLTSPYDLKESMSERSNARAIIIEEIKATLNVFLAQFYLPQGKTYNDVLSIAGAFWNEYSSSIDSWINVGAPQFREKMSSETNFDFLDQNYAPTGSSVRNYVLDKVTY